METNKIFPSNVRDTKDHNYGQLCFFVEQKRGFWGPLFSTHRYALNTSVKQKIQPPKKHFDTIFFVFFLPRAYSKFCE